MYQSYYMSILGLIKINASEKGITRIEFVDDIDDYNENDHSKLGAKEIEEYFMDHRTSFDLPLDLDGTPFQKVVWNAIMAIPYGNVMNHLELTKILNINEYDAIETAIKNNPMPIIIPSHRIKLKDNIFNNQLLLKLEGYDECE